MAELVGVIASAVTFGTVVAQLTKSITSLKDFCEQIRDLPSDMLACARYRGDIETELVQKPITSVLNDSKHVQQSLEFCREAAVGLETTYKDLVQDVQSGARIPQYYAMMKLVMRRSRIEKYKSRLQDVLRLLLLSQQCYTRALLLTRPELIAQEIVRQQKESSNEVFENEMPEPGGHRRHPMVYPTNRHYSTAGVGVSRNSHSFRNKALVWRASLPPWVTTKALEISGLKFPDGWQWIFRTYNSIPLGSEAVFLAGSGDIQGLQRLFASKQASPFDRIDGNGYTLLHYAGGINRHAVLEFLLNEGADMSIAGNFSHPVTTISYLVWSGSVGGEQGHTLLPSLRILLRRSEELYETPEETISGFLSEFHGTAEEFLFCQQRCCPNFYRMPQWTRVAVAARAASGVWDAYHMPEMIRTVLGESALGAERIQQVWASENYPATVTLVHSVAHKLGRSQAGMQLCHSPARKPFQGAKELEASWTERDEFKKQKKLCESWNCLFREFLLSGIDLRQIVDGKTPLIAFLQGYFHHDKRPKYESSACVTALRSWLTGLKAAGIGRKEVKLWKSGTVQREIFCVGGNEEWKRLINLVYGAYPSDWNIWFSECSDSYAGEFWDLIEREVEAMPGGWPVD
ncbi:uncharacterized protein N7477_005822 [Penicillium maclennaniae]|uniref:uncharacterized protein n=1 Tax=Penicillium maclennaniae TaxID=1343394 RepID=UPI002540EB6A|nr:uncharacterized protein N7477_005822 [Penicillium maclennaniae]KAJ5670459.1 hypothetical protein N7477_005822 [Penicillium maclennaniae]